MFKKSFLLFLIFLPLIYLTCTQNPILPDGIPIGQYIKSSNRIVLIGNSQQGLGIDTIALSEALQCSVESKWLGGAKSSWKFAALYQTLRQKPLPRIIVISTDKNSITRPSFRTEGKYSQEISDIVNGDAYLKFLIDSIYANAGYITDEWDFNGSVQYTFLPLIISEANKAGVPLIFNRFRTCDYVNNPFWNGEIGKVYRKELAEYLHQYGIPFLDYTLNPEIMREHYMDCWHFNEAGKKIWTGQLCNDLGACIKRSIAENDISFTGNLEYMDTVMTLSECAEKDTIMLDLLSQDEALWSYIDASAAMGERYIGKASTMSFIVPAEHRNPRVINFYAYLNGCKFKKSISVNGTPGINRPPIVIAGVNEIIVKNKPYVLSGTVKDDMQNPAKPLQISWSIVSGEATLMNQSNPRCSVMVENPGVTVLRLTADDGEYERFDDVTLLVNEEEEITIIEPSNFTIWTAGETGYIKWSAVGIDKVIIECSFDNGMTFTPIDETITQTDPRWGNYPFLVPLIVPQTYQAIIHISNYEKTRNAYSTNFMIKNPFLNP